MKCCHVFVIWNVSQANDVLSRVCDLKSVPGQWCVVTCLWSEVLSCVCDLKWVPGQWSVVMCLWSEMCPRPMMCCHVFVNWNVSQANEVLSRVCDLKCVTRQWCVVTCLWSETCRLPMMCCHVFVIWNVSPANDVFVRITNELRRNKKKAVPGHRELINLSKVGWLQSRRRTRPAPRQGCLQRRTPAWVLTRRKTRFSTLFLSRARVHPPALLKGHQRARGRCLLTERTQTGGWDKAVVVQLDHLCSFLFCWHSCVRFCVWHVIVCFGCPHANMQMFFGLSRTSRHGTRAVGRTSTFWDTSIYFYSIELLLSTMCWVFGNWQNLKLTNLAKVVSVLLRRVHMAESAILVNHA